MSAINQIFESMPIREYHAHNSLSSSKIKHLIKSPRNYWNEYLNPVKLETADEDEEKLRKKFKMGQATHVLTLEPHLFDSEYFGLPKLDRRTKDGKAQYEQLISENEGKVELKEEEYLKIEGMSNAVKQTKLFHHMKTEGKFECSFFWVDPDTGLQVKSRPDWHDGRMYIDLKTTTSLSRFAKSIFEFKYHVQAAIAREAFRHLYKKEYDYFAYLVVEDKEPYLTDYFVLDLACLDRGEHEYREALKTFKECSTRNVWPKLEESFKMVYLPSWM